MPYAQQLGRYQLLDRIAFGGMAELYRAKTFDARGHAHLVAVKRVLQHLTADEDFIRMLVDEARVTAILDHPCIARVYEFSHAGDEYFIAMEYVDGKDVRALLEKHRQLAKPMAPEHVAWIIANIADGLHAAHTQTDADGSSMHIVHRDVSPSNLLVSYDGDVKLCDFGIAKTVLGRVQTRTGVIKGKVKYMSPEQAMGRKLDGRSDLFALGTVMYEMLTLEAPFVAATEVELIFAVRDARKRSAREHVPSIPEEIHRILERMMERQRTDRYQSGAEIARDLFYFLEKFYPNYKKSHFSRFMRSMFPQEIEKELRQLESWILEPGDASNVGVNLIADALPNNAEFRSFSAVSHPALPVAESPERPAPSGDLHAQETRIVPRNAVQENIHARSTLMLEGRDAEQLRAELGIAPVSSSNLHAGATQIFADAVDELPRQQTHILDRDAATTASARSTQDTAPEAPRVFVGAVPTPNSRPAQNVFSELSDEDEDDNQPTNPRRKRP